MEAINNMNYNPIANNKNSKNEEVKTDVSEENKEEKKQNEEQIVGGLKDTKVDEMVFKAAEAVKQQVIAQANFAKIKEYKAVSAKSQVVAGINYCIKIKTDKDEYAHICVHAKLDKTYELQGILFDKTINDPLDFECKNKSQQMDPKQIANSFVAKIFHNDQDSGNDKNGVYKNDVNAISDVYRAVYPPAMMTMDFNPNRLNIFMEKETNKIQKVTWG